MQALPLYHDLGDRKAEVRTLRNLGAIYSDLNDGRKALYYYTQVLPLLRAVGDRKSEVTTLNNIGRGPRGADAWIYVRRGCAGGSEPVAGR
jgi:hypothetical protein